MSQRMQALQRANEIRIAKAQLRRDLTELSSAEARQRVALLLRSPDDVVGALQINALVCAVPRVGAGSCRELLRHAGIGDPQRRVRTLTVRQREALAMALEHPRLVRPGAVWHEPRGCCPRCGQRLTG